MGAVLERHHEGVIGCSVSNILHFLPAVAHISDPAKSVINHKCLRAKRSLLTGRDEDEVDRGPSDILYGDHVLTFI